jgi:hypothetical protein
VRRIALLLGLAVLAAGCGGSRSSGPGTSTSVSTAQARMTLIVYVVRDGKLAAERRLVPRTPAVAAAALEQLGFPVRSLAIAGGIATVEPARQPSDLERAQVVFTLTEFPSVQRVSFGGKALTRTDLDLFAPPIVVVEPQRGDPVRSPVRVHGSADAFEATFQIDVLDGDGTVVAHKTVTATTGSGERGDYDVSIPFEAAKPGPGTIVAYEDSAENGQRIHVVEVPVVLM